MLPPKANKSPHIPDPDPRGAAPGSDVPAGFPTASPPVEGGTAAYVPGQKGEPPTAEPERGPAAGAVPGYEIEGVLGRGGIVPRADDETGVPGTADWLFGDMPTQTQAPSSHSPPLPQAVSVPGYEVLGVLGRGGMGVVYKARHLGLGRIVALKMILAGEHASPEERIRFRSEAEAVARLQHPHIIQVYEIGEHAGRPYFSLEFLDG